MLETSARLLRLLSLLQTRRDWPGTDLASRLGVSARTVRRDVDRLRGLGYPVHATMGTTGGYRLGAGAALPPLLLDDEEAVAVAVGLRTATNGTVTGIEETSLRALAKLEQVLPSRLRHRVSAMQAATVAIPGFGPTVDAEVLTAVANACRDRLRLRFDYRDHAATDSVRTVEPHRLVCLGRRWYLLAWDVDRGDWRTFRADRMRPRVPTGPRFAPRDPPGGDVVRYVSRSVTSTAFEHRATVRLHASAESLAGRVWQVHGALEPVDDRTSLLHIGAETPQTLAVLVGMLDVDFDVVEPDGLREHLRALSERYARAATPTRCPPAPWT